MEKEKLYRKIMKSNGMKVAKDGKLSFHNNIVKVNKKPLIIETEYSDLDNVVMFDPMDVDLTKTDLGLKKLLRIISLKANSLVFELLKIILDEKIEDLPSFFYVLKLTADAEINGDRKKPIKVIVPSTLTALNKLEEYSIEESLYFLKPILKCPLKDKGDRFKAGVIVSSPLIDAFEDGENEIHNLFKRERDGLILKKLIEGLYGYMGLGGIASVTNSDQEQLVVYMKFYIKFTEVINGMLDALKSSSEELHDVFYINTKLTSKDIEELLEHTETVEDYIPSRKPSKGGRKQKVDEWGAPIEDDYDDDYDRPRSRSRGRGRDDYDDDYDRPRSRGRGRNRDDYDDDYDRPRGRDRDRGRDDYYDDDVPWKTKGEGFVSVAM